MRTTADSELYGQHMPIDSIWSQAVEMGFKNLGFCVFLSKNLKNANFRFFRKTLKIQILHSQSQQKIVLFQSD